MSVRVLIGTTAQKTFFDISKNFKVVPRHIFHADSESVIHFCVRVKLSLQFEKRSENDLRKNIGIQILQYEGCVLQYCAEGS
jgi:hypothetical protein